jgi:VIT1/CCC1 family predicted Fe2+/Mn2+ transporter
VSWREHWVDEKQSAYLYRVIAGVERAPTIAHLFENLAQAAEEQAATWERKLREQGDARPLEFAPSARARVVAALVRKIGPRRMKPALAALKVRGLSIYSRNPAHAGHVMPTSLEDFGSRHRSVTSGGALRAAVFGVNDGLVSNTSLILGLAGASAEPRIVVLTGFAGLLAGAFSMAAGEWISTRSQRELFEHQIALERDELAEYPEQEAEELALIYEARGLSRDEAHTLAKSLMSDPEHALDTLAREELGLNPADLGSPWRAAISSFLAFAAGAAIPLTPFAFVRRDQAIFTTAIVAASALFAVGCTFSLFTGRNALASGARMVAIGGAAALATWSIGHWLGVAVD